MTDEVPLAGGAVVRIGDTVRRPPGPSSTLMREVLQHLERVGFDGAPRFLGIDERGRDILTWIDGDTFGERGRLHPYLAADAPITFTQEQLGEALSLLRRYHDAFAGDVVCHGDYGPWNIVWREGRPIAAIDFGNVARGPAAHDIGYALRMFVGYGLVAAEPRDLVERTTAALRAYGAIDLDVPQLLAAEYDRAEARCRGNGWWRQLARLPSERAWLAEHAGLFSGLRAPT